MRTTERRGILGTLRLRSILAVNLILAGLLAWGFSGEYARHHALEREIAALQARAEELREGNLERERQHERSLSESGLEREARLKLNLRKPGEEVIIVQGVPAISGARALAPAATSTAEHASGDAEPTSNAERWHRFLFKR